jgi:tetratricopeptide (TPR) repeat protein
MQAANVTAFDGVADYSVAPFAEALAYLAYALWLRGRPGRAREVQRAALDAAEQLGHPATLAVIIMQGAFSSLLAGEAVEAYALARRAEDISIEHGFRDANDIAAIWHGAALVAAGRTAEGLAMMRDAVDRYTATAARLASPMLAMQAWGCLRSGEVAEGLATVERALDLGRATFDHMFEAELWRLKGELLLAGAASDVRVKSRTSTQKEAEGCFERALAVSRAQGATSLELRVLTSLARVWHQRGHGVQARDLLAPIIDRFAEDLDTPDLREAQQLLRDIGA